MVHYEYEFPPHRDWGVGSHVEKFSLPGPIDHRGAWAHARNVYGFGGQLKVVLPKPEERSRPIFEPDDKPDDDHNGVKARD